jgi:hypothetical protein
MLRKGIAPMKIEMVISNVIVRNSGAEPNGTVFWIFVAALVLIATYKIYSAVMEQVAINEKNEFRRSKRRPPRG